MSLYLKARRDFGPFTLACDLALPPSRILGLFGPSGCGKSTLLRIIAGLDRAPGDALRWQGRELAALPPEARRIGLVFQDARLFPHLSVLGNLQLAARKGRGRWQPQALAARLGFAELLGQPAHGLSGGQRQRVALARALLAEPDLLLLDEPSLRLAPIVIQQIFDTIEQLRQKGMTIFLVEQNANQALKLAVRGYVL